MSDPVSALNGDEFQGLAQVCECGLAGMVTLRGDLKDGALQGAVSALTGVSVPSPRGFNQKDDKAVAWMSPDELLILLPHQEAPAAVHSLAASLGGIHALAVEVSDARALFSVKGPSAREVLAKLFPVDFHPDSFGTGQIRRSHLAQIPAAVWMADKDMFHVVVFRSVAKYAFDALCAAAAPGSGVGYFRG